MSKTGRFGPIVLIAASVALTVGGALTAYQEVNVFAVGGITPNSRFAALATGTFSSGPSLLSKRLLLNACRGAILGLYGRLQPHADRQTALTECQEQADAAVAAAPSFSYGWYVGALVAAHLDDANGFNTRMLQSQITGPTEQWIAEMRANLVEEYIEVADEDVMARHLADLRLLVASRRGIASISRRYVRDPEFRERITAIVEAMLEEDQARFVATVRRSARSAAP